MINKILIQIILFIFVLLAGGAYYYFFNKGSIDNKIAGKEDDKIKVKENVSNLIENIFYTSTDGAGNKFEIKSLTGEMNIDNPDIVYMTDVEAIIYLVNSAPIKIKSKYAKYNKKDYETNFKENILISYIDKEIQSENLDLSFENNLATIYNKIVYNDNNTILYADIIEIDLITKNSRVFMHNDLKKIKVSTKN